MTGITDFGGALWTLLVALSVVSIIAAPGIYIAIRGAKEDALRPFAWIILSPIFTVSMQAWLLSSIVGAEHCRLVRPGAGIGTEVWECPSGDVWLTLMPGLVNLAPFLWLVSSNSWTRRAATSAGLLGLARFALPLLIYVAEGDVPMNNFWFWDSAQDPSVLVSWLLWGCSNIGFFLVDATVRHRSPWLMLAFLRRWLAPPSAES